MRKLWLSIYLTILVILVACSSQSLPKEISSQTLRIVNKTVSPSEYKEIRDTKTIQMILNVVDEDELRWSYVKPSIDRESDYQFWVEKKNVPERHHHFEVWLNDKESVILNKNKGQYAIIESTTVEQLNGLLK
ncbi:hypothetical protein P6P90_17350 [Ectobacillus antri]|uniref:Lipoprotein n=1 Tax=Ectobacillus antri TaxID=2486280 RepID=A0ABT6H8K3_9BACI|nr:hypothetical protein [Ectobacillus antri]MDG4658612.1 hypothetical protein [Ectobacillus antri]MDG5755656.1 hypothetical protein [Ectobacillus antri]